MRIFLTFPSTHEKVVIICILYLNVCKSTIIITNYLMRLSSYCKSSSRRRHNSGTKYSTFLNIIGYPTILLCQCSLNNWLIRAINFYILCLQLIPLSLCIDICLTAILGYKWVVFVNIPISIVCAWACLMRLKFFEIILHLHNVWIIKIIVIIVEYWFRNIYFIVTVTVMRQLIVPLIHKVDFFRSFC